MRSVCRLLLVVISLTVAACSGGGGGTPTSPNTPTPTSITITSSGSTVFLGANETFTATIAFSNGTIQTLAGGVWGTDAASIATVGASNGVVTGVASGEVTIFVDAQGLRGTKRITVVPNYQGIWFGRYSVDSCTDTGGFVTVGLCAEFTANSPLPISFNLTQVGQSVTGRVALGTLISDTFTASTASNGGLTFDARYFNGTTTIAQAWQIRIATAGRIDGSVVQTWSDLVVSGGLVLRGTLQEVVIPAFAPSSAPSPRQRATTSLREVGTAARR